MGNLAFSSANALAIHYKWWFSIATYVRLPEGKTWKPWNDAVKVMSSLEKPSSVNWSPSPLVSIRITMERHIFMGKLTTFMAIFHRYVHFPEGRSGCQVVFVLTVTFHVSDVQHHISMEYSSWTSSTGCPPVMCVDLQTPQRQRHPPHIMTNHDEPAYRPT